MKKLLLETKETSKKRSNVLAASNIRKELKHNFSGVKFSVTSSRGSINISWTDGVIGADVDQIVNKYKRGRFDGMSDSYDYKKDFDSSFGDSDYIFTNRDYSSSAYREAMKEVILYDNEEINTYTDSNGDIIGLNINDYHTNNRFNDFMRNRNYLLSMEDQRTFDKNEEIKKEEEYQAFKIKQDEENKIAATEYKKRMEEINVPVNSKSICPKLHSFITLKFANLNKNNTLGEYKEEVNKGDYTDQECKIEKVVFLSTSKFDNFAINLLNPFEFLGEGGTNSDDERLKNLPDEFWKWTKEQNEIFINTSYNLVTAIIAPNRGTFYVDAQGYKYARYVAVV